jgi:type VI protein secretion system component VasF
MLRHTVYLELSRQRENVICLLKELEATIARTVLPHLQGMKDSMRNLMNKGAVYMIPLCITQQKTSFSRDRL